MSVEAKNLAHGFKNENAPLPGKQIVPQNENQENSYHQDNDRSVNQRELEEQDIPEYIQMLEEHQAICEREGRYVEADLAKNRIIELKGQMEAGKKEEIMQRHFIEKQQIEEEHMSEFNEFNEFWDKKMAEFNEQAAAIEEQMMLRHQEEMRKFLEELEMSIPTKPRDSAEILNLRRIQQTLAKQKDYIEAHKIQQQCMKLERVEMEKWHNVREHKMRNQKIQLENKQTNELNAIRKRILTGQEEQRKARSLDLERLLHKYQNIRKDLNLRHQAELNQVTRSSKGSSTFGSTFRSQNSKMNMSNNSSMYKWNANPASASSKKRPLHENNSLNRSHQIHQTNEKRSKF